MCVGEVVSLEELTFPVDVRQVALDWDSHRPHPHTLGGEGVWVWGRGRGLRNLPFL